MVGTFQADGCPLKKGQIISTEKGLLVLTKFVVNAKLVALLTQRATTTAQDAIIQGKVVGAFRPRGPFRTMLLVTRALDAQVRQAQPACHG